jgi:hypothetical protein
VVDDGEDQPADQLTNAERLQRHLKEDSLATRLVQAYVTSSGSIDALKGVIGDRLDQVRQDLDSD